jgi:NADH dehydrogenase FAD-containing subunit
MQYSGMVPGWMAGEYRDEETRIALAPLVREARIDWRRCRAVGLDPVSREVLLETGERIAFDVCSIAIGGAGRAENLVGRDPRLIDIRPIDGFMERWDEVEDTAAARRVVGRELESQNITVLTGEAQFDDHGALTVEDKAIEPFDAILAAVGSGAPSWPRESGLPVDEDGFIRVGPTQQVEGLPQILAAGDVARRTDVRVRHSGVHAVYAGPVLATNLRRLIAGRSDLATYSPFGKDFYLFNTCRGTSILSYGAFGLKARWLRRLKDWLDRRWIARFSGR